MGLACDLSIIGGVGSHDIVVHNFAILKLLKRKKKTSLKPVGEFFTNDLFFMFSWDWWVVYLSNIATGVNGVVEDHLVVCDPGSAIRVV